LTIERTYREQVTPQRSEQEWPKPHSPGQGEKAILGAHIFPTVFAFKAVALYLPAKGWCVHDVPTQMLYSDISNGWVSHRLSGQITEFIMEIRPSSRERASTGGD
jgi:hypothetical protein